MDKAATDLDAARGNARIQINHLAMQLRRQDSTLLMVEAVAKAARLVSRGVTDLFDVAALDPDTFPNEGR